MLLAELGGDEGPQLYGRGNTKTLVSTNHNGWKIPDQEGRGVKVLGSGLGFNATHLVDVDLGLPLVVAEKVESSHTNLTEVTGMVFVEVRTVVVLTTGHTTTTGVLLNEDYGQYRFYSDSPSYAQFFGYRGSWVHSSSRTLRCLPTRPLPALTWPRCYRKKSQRYWTPLNSNLHSTLCV